MSSGKKGKKTKGKPVSLGEFLGTSNPSGGSAVVISKSSWADETEDYEEDRYVATERLVLPTAPRNARGPDVDPDRIPRDPPFTAYIANLPFEVSENDIERFFGDLRVKSIRLPRDSGENGRFKGFGYVEFGTRAELMEALTKNEDTMGNRKIRIDVAGGEGGNQRRGYSDRGGGNRDRDEDRLDRSEGVSDWRAAPRDSAPRDGGRDDRSPPRGGFERDRWDDRRDGYGDRDRGGFGDRDRDRGGFGDRDRDRGGFGDRDRDRGGFGDRDRERGGFGDRERGGRYGGGNRYDDDRRGGGGGFRDDPWRRERDDQSFSRGGEDTGPRERPKLKLKPRSAPVTDEKKESTGVGAGAGAGAGAGGGGGGGGGGGSIFGDAKPVDTASRELQIEKKLQAKEPAPKREEQPPPRRLDRREDLRDVRREDNRDIRVNDEDRRDRGEVRKTVRDDRDKRNDVDSDENHDPPQQRGKPVKDEPVIIDTANKFAGLDLEAED